MPRVSILRRDKAVQFPDPQRVEEVVAVTYATDVVPPRIVNVALEAYREATPEEKAANSAYQFVPVDGSAEELERKAIAQDLDRARGAPLTSFDL